MKYQHESQQEARVRFTTFLESGHYRKTQERYAIFDKIWSLKAHFGVDDLYQSLESEGYHVSLSTVYSTVELLCQSGILRRLFFDRQQARYEIAEGSHIHLVCSNCGKVKEVRDPELLKMMQLRRYEAFHTSYFSMNVYGLCSVCVRQIKKRKSAAANVKPKKL